MSTPRLDLRRLAAAVATALALLAPALPSTARAGDKVQAGRWEITATAELPGTPAIPTTQVECLSQADVDADPVPELDRGACRAKNVSRSGNRVSWTLVCSGALNGTGRGEIVYQGPTAYSGWMTLEAGGTTMKVTLRARRLGGC